MIVEQKDWDDLTNYRESLEHYGRKGMHWYEHIFGKEQGHAKYSKDSPKSSDKKKTFRERQAERAKKRESDKAEKAKVKAEKEAAKKEEKRQKILKNPTLLYKHRDEYTYDEIKKAMDRFDWEKKLSTYSKEDLQRGADFMKTMYSYVDNGIKLYNAAARIVNSLTGDKDTNTLPFIKKADDGGSKDSKKNNKNDNKNDKKIKDALERLGDYDKGINEVKKLLKDVINDDKNSKKNNKKNSRDDDDDDDDDDD